MAEQSNENTGEHTGSLVSFTVDQDLKTAIHIDGLVLGGLIVLCLVFIFLRGKRLFGLKSFEIDEAEFGIGDHKIKLKPNNVDMQIAYKVWVELSTRKIGLPVDFENDVISEVYDSWYGFFSVTRELIKEVPVSKFRRKETEAIVRLSIEVLNSGIRPHLTLWQAKFRRWYEHELQKDCNKGISPQKIQEQFDEYEVLVSDLKVVNKKLMRYRKKMYQLITTA